MGLEQFIPQVDIFSTLTPPEVECLVPVLRSRTLIKDEILFAEGDPGDELFIIQSGAVSVSVMTDKGETIVLSQLENRDFFGEMSIFEGAPRSATCRALERTELIALGASEFFAIMDSNPGIAVKIMNRMLVITTARLQSTNTLLKDLVRWGKDARRRAVTDELTGLFNRRFFDSALESQFKAVRFRKKTLSLVMIDLDHFGSINKAYGEALANKILVDVAEVFKSSFEKPAIITRYGGDEFAVIFPETSGNVVEAVCKKMCQNLETVMVPGTRAGRLNRVTASVGIAVFPDHAVSIKDLLDKTDEALYQAKERGRDQAVLFENSSN